MLIGLVLVSVSVKTKIVELVNNTFKKTRLKFLKDWIKNQLLGLGLSIFLLINLEMDIFHLLIWTMILSQISLLSEDIIGEELIVMNLTNLSTPEEKQDQRSLIMIAMESLVSILKLEEPMNMIFVPIQLVSVLQLLEILQEHTFQFLRNFSMPA